MQPSLRLCEVARPVAGSCGFHLSRTIWDPYPWVSGVDPGSPAETSGLRAGDCVLEVNGEDVLGKRVGEVAQKVRARDDKVVLLLWNAGSHPNSFDSAESGRGSTPICLQRLSGCLQSIVQLLECPVCLETASSPTFQCCNGHMLCGACRSRTDKCPVCRATLGPRGRCLLADKIRALLENDLRGGREVKTASVATTSAQPELRVKSRTVEHVASEKRPFHCPYSLGRDGCCPEVLDGSDSLLRHLRERHPGPLVQHYAKSGGVKLRLPLASSRSVGSSSLLSLVIRDGTVFFVKVAKVPGRRLVWLWLLGDAARADGYRLRLTFPEGDAHAGPVFPLTSSRTEVVDSNCCLSIEEGRYVNGNPDVKVEILEAAGPARE